MEAPSLYTLVVFTPLTHADKVREALAAAGAGSVGRYDSCSFTVRGVGRFRPLDGANPAVGSVGALEEVPEERLEAVVLADQLQAVLRALTAAHPYEEPAIQVSPILNYKTFL